MYILLNKSYSWEYTFSDQQLDSNKIKESMLHMVWNKNGSCTWSNQFPVVKYYGIKFNHSKETTTPQTISVANLLTNVMEKTCKDVKGIKVHTTENWNYKEIWETKNSNMFTNTGNRTLCHNFYTLGMHLTRRGCIENSTMRLQTSQNINSTNKKLS